MMTRFVSAVLLSFTTSFVLGCATSSEILISQDSPYRSISSLKEGAILHVPTGVEVTKEQCFDLLAEKRIVYVGEAHTNLAHHRVELEILQAMESRHPGRVALGMEMFGRSAQATLDQWVAGKLGEKSFLREWYANWTADYGYYRQILEFAREMKIPVLALNATDEQVRGLAEKGLEGLSEEIRKSIPDLDPNDPYHRKAMEAVFGGHVPSHPSGGRDKKAFERFYQTMLLWDETMAQGVVDYLKSPAGQKRQMVVMTGGFHVGYGFGVPRRVFRRLPVSYAVVLPQTGEITEGRERLLMDVETPRLPLYIADFVWKTGHEDLEEDQVRLGVFIEVTEKGVTIREVSPGSPAAKAGLKVGDVITALGGEAINEPFDLTYLVPQKKPGDKAILKYLREGQPSEVEVTFQPLTHP
ncbi:MAG: ChaN family lipoprotein [Nitrospiria bacterium]